MKDLRKSKTFTFVVWLLGVALFAAGFYRRNWTLQIMGPVTFIGGMVWAGMGLYSYYWGHQKGHPVRFYSILLFSCFSLGFFLNSMAVISGVWYVLIPISLAGATILLNDKYKKRFWNDFHSGIKRDHFKKRVEKI